MASWSAEDGEPRAPDKKNEDTGIESSDNVSLNLKESILDLKDQSNTSSQAASSTNQSDAQITNLNSTTTKTPDDKEIETLDEGQLKALLDEAITYKNPKDREGKSELFKELLQEVEAKECENKDEGLVTNKNQRFISSKRRHHKRDVGCTGQSGVGGSTTRGGSLQNLHSLSNEPTHPRIKVKRFAKFTEGEDLVSTRQREGGSLPSYVNVQGRDNDLEVEKFNKDIICSYTSCATLEVTADQKRDKASTNVDLAISLPISKQSMAGSMNGIEQSPLQLGSSYNSVKSLVGASSTPEQGCSNNEASSSVMYPLPVQHVSVLSIPPEILAGQDQLARAGLELRPTRAALDENGNAVGSTKSESTTSTSGFDRKNKRRLKTKVDNTVLAENIEGHRGEADIDSLLNYIESTSGTIDVNKVSKSKVGPNSGPRNFKARAKEEGKRRGRDVEKNLLKCNSLEEISKTKLEDLTEENISDSSMSMSRAKPKKQVTLDDAHLGGSCNLAPLDRQPYLDDRVPNRNKQRKKKTDIPVETLQDSEFHVVTKKQRKKKRRTGCSSRLVSKKMSGYYGGKGFPPHDGVMNRDTSGSLLYRYQQKGNSMSESQPRRKSASSVPSSEKSDSSDLDSVHSLPVSSTATRNRASGESTPQASYADITRSATSPPRCVSHGNIARKHLGIKSSPSSTVPSSNASSRAGDEESVPSPEPVHTVTFTVPPPCAKKDAMTGTDFDLLFPQLHKDYPPLERKSINSDLFVEFTVKRSRTVVPRESSVSVEETIVLKNPPLNLSVKDEHSNLMKTESSSNLINIVKDSDNINNTSDPIINSRPPVILLNDPALSNYTCELTFGFEVNEQLLQNEEQLNYSRTSSVQSHALTNRLVNYVRQEWRQVEKDLKSGKAVYFKGQ